MVLNRIATYDAMIPGDQNTLLSGELLKRKQV